MNHKSAVRHGRVWLVLFSALSWGFCILFYASVFWKKETIWMAGGTVVVLGYACTRGSRFFRNIIAGLGGAGLAGACAVTLLVSVGGGQYEPVEGSYVQSVYRAPEKVMVIVPHEDDDLNVAGGVIDSYRAAGTEVKVVFFSNGDYRFKNAYRQLEALRSEKALGVPGEDVIFMGYGDQYKTPYGHLYNAPDHEPVASHAGYKKTYGLKSHPEYRKSVSGSSAAYTRADAVNDMMELLDSQRPDVIYCVDFDSNPDHRATGLLFEEVMGNLLRSGGDYHPVVYKGFAYSTAWSAREDYYGLNVPSTVLRYKDGRMKETNYYIWEDRFRLPVRPQDLAYTCRASALWPAYRAYGSQKAILHMDSVVNGDKVFWRRRTDSVLYTASFSSGAKGDTSFLNDFKLADSGDVADRGHRPFDGIWKAGKGDVLKVKLEKPAVVSQIRLYDNPSPEHNILQACITLDNGKQMLTGPLEPKGAASETVLPSPVKISGFTVEILETEGGDAGLCELEAYCGAPEIPAFIKLTDGEENFVYTYTPGDEKDIRLKLYGSTPELERLITDAAVNFTVTAEGETLKHDGKEFLLPCPHEKVTVRAQLDSDPSIYDEIVVKPYSALRAAWVPCLRPLDTMVCAFSTYTRYYLAHAENAFLRLLGKI
ncbi:MAG: PIG-L family deacetylase [Eubacteriales bacterium]|nr:PIG-L family deacetylase [Eubacteriales bacterium]